MSDTPAPEKAREKENLHDLAKRIESAILALWERGEATVVERPNGHRIVINIDRKLYKKGGVEYYDRTDPEKTKRISEDTFDYIIKAKDFAPRSMDDRGLVGCTVFEVSYRSKYDLYAYNPDDRGGSALPEPASLQIYGHDHTGKEDSPISKITIFDATLWDKISPGQLSLDFCIEDLEKIADFLDEAARQPKNDEEAARRKIVQRVRTRLGLLNK